MDSDRFRYKALDVVVVASTPRMVEVGEAGRRGVILEVRRYPDGTHRYGLGHMTDGEMGGLYGHDDLEWQGESATWIDGVVDTDPQVFQSSRVTPGGDLVGHEGYVVLERVLESD